MVILRPATSMGHFPTYNLMSLAGMALCSIMPSEGKIQILDEDDLCSHMGKYGGVHNLWGCTTGSFYWNSSEANEERLAFLHKALRMRRCKIYNEKFNRMESHRCPGNLQASVIGFPPSLLWTNISWLRVIHRKRFRIKTTHDRSREGAHGDWWMGAAKQKND